MMAVIPARGGSKGLPGKNIRPLGGAPLIVRTLLAARAASGIDRVVVSTDDDAIMRVAREVEGVELPVRRPAHLAGDDAAAIDAYLHLMDSLEIIEGRAPEAICILLPTAPLRTADDIDAAIGLFRRTGAHSVVSVAPAKPLSWIHTVDGDGRMSPAVADTECEVNRQALPPAFLPNGAIYVVDVATMRRRRAIYGGDCFAYVMPPERSVDIDTETDFALAEVLLERQVTHARDRDLLRAV